MSLLHSVTSHVQSAAKSAGHSVQSDAKAVGSAVTHPKAAIAKALSAAAASITGFGHGTGWTLVTMNTLGTHLGEKIVMGGGVIKLSVANKKTGETYAMSGAYVEGGVGVDMIKLPKGAKVADRFKFKGAKVAVKAFCKAFNFEHKGSLPKGTNVEFLKGPMAPAHGLTRAHFEHATWLYYYVDITAEIANAEVGFLFVLPPANATELVVAAEAGPLALAMLSWAFCPHYAIGVGIGAEAAALVRYIKEMKIGPISKIFR